MVLLGLGTAALLVASFSGAQKAAMEANKLSEDDIHAAISGIWTSAFALGNFIGPTFGGLLVDGYNFETTTTVFQVLYIDEAKKLNFLLILFKTQKTLFFRLLEFYFC